MDKKFKIEFTESNVQDSVAYILVTEFDLRPNVLKAEIDGDGSGVMILALAGDEEKLEAAQRRLEEEGFIVKELDKRINRDETLCWDCGECVSICPVGCFSVDPETFKICLDNSKCIACGACLNACSVHSLSIHL
jgi:NAD-dependent dihydropyrimidine dehydrogenase PreA subunit